MTGLFCSSKGELSPFIASAMAAESGDGRCAHCRVEYSMHRRVFFCVDCSLEEALDGDSDSGATGLRHWQRAQPSADEADESKGSASIAATSDEKDDTCAPNHLHAKEQPDRSRSCGSGPARGGNC